MEAVRIAIRVVPNASATRCEGRDTEGVFKIRLQARPEKGKANKALILFLAKQLGIGRTQVTLVRGETARLKQVAITGLTETEIASRLQPTQS